MKLSRAGKARREISRVMILSIETYNFTDLSLLKNIVQISSFSQFSYVRSTKWDCNTRLQFVTWKYDYASELVHPMHVEACSCVTIRDCRLLREEERESTEETNDLATLWAPLRTPFLPSAFASPPSPRASSRFVPIVSFPREISAAINSAAADRSLE